MNARLQPLAAMVSIAAVERDTGLSKDTLRVWERRYGFPQPARDALGERAYPLDQLEKLRLIRRLMDAGHRPGRIVPLPAEALERLVLEGRAAAAAPVPAPASAEGGSWLELLQRHDMDALLQRMQQHLARDGLAHFVMHGVVPLNALVGQAWLDGQLQIFEEHLYTEAVTRVLRAGMAQLPDRGQTDGPRVLLTTFPQEPHALGLLMAEALLVLQGCRCTSLGVQTPVPDIARAAVAARADVVALSFSASLNANDVLHGLKDLRAALPPTTAIWAGGSCPVLHRRTPEGVVPVRDLRALAPLVTRWCDGVRDGAVAGPRP